MLLYVFCDIYFSISISCNEDVVELSDAVAVFVFKTFLVALTTGTRKVQNLRCS